MKHLIFALSIGLLGQQAICQDVAHPCLSYEIGLGYDYGFLESFNTNYIEADEQNVFDKELHSGFSINTKVPFHITNYLDVGLDVSLKRFSINDAVSPVNLTDGHAFTGAFRYESTVSLSALEGGLSSSFWVSKLFEANKSSRFSVGVEAFSAFGIVRFRNLKVYSFPDGQKGYHMSHRGTNEYLRVGGGLIGKCDLQIPVIRSVILKCGYSEIFGSFDDLDTGGVYAKLMLTLGKRLN